MEWLSFLYTEVRDDKMLWNVKQRKAICSPNSKDRGQPTVGCLCVPIEIICIYFPHTTSATGGDDITVKYTMTYRIESDVYVIRMWVHGSHVTCDLVPLSVVIVRHHGDPVHVLWQCGHIITYTNIINLEAKNNKIIQETADQVSNRIY